MLSRPRAFTVSTEEPEQGRVEPPSPHRRVPTGLWLHIGAGAVLIAVMAIAALYVMRT